MTKYTNTSTFARRLRRKATPAEEIVWEILRNRQLSGLKFKRQHPILYYVENGIPKYFIADFYCAQKKLVIELDGDIHLTQQEYDQFRNDTLLSLGYHTLRLKNEVANNIEDLKAQINLFVAELSGG